MTNETLSTGHALFAQYAYPPNELGYCGPADGGGASGLAAHAKEFDGAWPYLAAIAEAVGVSDPLDEDVVSSYWVGGPSLARVDSADLLTRLRTSFKGQVAGLLDAVHAAPGVLAHHSFHVFVVYPWVRFLDRDWATALGVMQDCRIRWGTVESVAGGYAVIASRPLQLDDGALALGEPGPSGCSGRRVSSRWRPPRRRARLCQRTGTGCAGLLRTTRPSRWNRQRRPRWSWSTPSAPTAFPWPRDRSTLVS